MEFTAPALRLLCLAFLFCLPPTPSAGAVTINGVPVIVKGNSVSLKASGSVDDTDDKPAFSGDALKSFVALLKAYPRTRFVRISWVDSNILNFGGAQVLYDRARHTVTVAYSTGGQGDATFGGEVRFTSVRESAFAAILNTHPKGLYEYDPETNKIAQAHIGVYVDWDGFQFLYQPRYGCRSHVVKARHKIA